MDYDFSTVVGDGLPEFNSILAALKRQVDPAKLTDADRRAIENVGPETERYAVLQRLLSAGADAGKFGWTDIFLAVAFGTIGDLEEAVTGKSDIEAVDGHQRTAFLFSIQAGDVAKTKLLIDAGANVEAVGDCGETALGYAIGQDNVAMLEWLLEQGFDRNRKTAPGRRPLSQRRNGARSDV